VYLAGEAFMYLVDFTESAGEAHLSDSNGKTLKYFASNCAINCDGHFSPVLV
jgi:hypothetical protein